MNSTQPPPEVEAHIYTLDTDMAREGSGGVFDFINETGAYEGEIIEAKAIAAKTGAQGIILRFKSNEGKVANYLTLYTLNADGEVIYGQKQLNALMVCLDQHSLKPVEGTVTVFNTSTRQEEPETAMIYPDLCNKPIGLFLQREEYLGSYGEVKARMNFYAAFDASTKRTAIEILDNTSPTALDKMKTNIKDKRIPDSPSPLSSAKIPNEQNPLSASADDFSDDIPF